MILCDLLKELDNRNDLFVLSALIQNRLSEVHPSLEYVVDRGIEVRVRRKNGQSVLLAKACRVDGRLRYSACVDGLQEIGPYAQ